MDMLRLSQKKDLSQIIIIENLTQISPWTRETFEQCIQRGYLTWVIEQDDEVIAFIIVSRESGECHILNLCVHPNFQHQGHGKSLLQYVLKQMKKLNTLMVFLEVRRSNLNAIKLYQNLGFIQIGERVNYYPKGKTREDALIFAKDLSVE